MSEDNMAGSRSQINVSISNKAPVININNEFITKNIFLVFDDANTFYKTKMKIFNLLCIILYLHSRYSMPFAGRRRLVPNVKTYRKN